MSVATELPPVVYIPERARRASGLPTARPHLALVPAGTGIADRPTVGPVAARPTVRAVAAMPPAPRVATAAVVQPLRLTRRGALVLAAAVTMLGLVMLAVGYLSFPGASSAHRPAQSGVVTVQSGDTLWSIAQRMSPGRDPRAVVDQLRAQNHLADVVLTPGQTLKVG